MTLGDEGINTKMRGWLVACCAAVLLGCSAGLVVLSRSFVHGGGHAQRPIIGVVAVLLMAGGAWAASIRALASCRASTLRVAGVVAFSLVLGAIQFFARPIQEADFNRYLLDGALVACGLNPYQRPPQVWRKLLTSSAGGEVRPSDAGAKSGNAAPVARARQSAAHCLRDPRWRSVLERIEYSDIRTPYPALAQLWFGTVVGLFGPSLTALRASFLCAELALLLVLASLLRRLGLSPLLVAVVGWAPLMWKESVNSAHYDVVAALAVTVAARLLVDKREIWSAAALGAGAALKLFTIALLPLWLRCTPRKSRLFAACTAALVFGVVSLPFVGAGRALAEGCWTFATRWTASAPVFSAATGMLEAAGMSVDAARAAWLALAASAAVAVQLAWPLARHGRDGGIETLDVEPLRIARAVFAIVLIAGPAANPWYFCWLLPLVAVDPSAPWLALIAMQPLYYAGFFLIYHGRTELLPLVAWLQVAPFATLLLRDALYRNRSSAAGRIMSAARSRPASGGRAT